MNVLAHGVPARQTSYLDEHPAGQGMMYSVRSVSAHRVNSLATAPVEAQPPATPALAPHNVTAVPDLTAGGYRISWEAPETGTKPVAYQLAYTADGVWAPQVRFPADQFSHVDTTVEQFPYGQRNYQLISIYERTPGVERGGGHVNFATEVLPRPASRLNFRLGFNGVTINWSELLPHRNETRQIVRRPANQADAQWTPVETRPLQTTVDEKGHHHTTTVDSNGNTVSYVYGVRTANSYATAEPETVSEPIAMIANGGNASSVDALAASNQDKGVRLSWSEHWRNYRGFSGYIIGRATLAEGQNQAYTSDYEIIGRIDFESVKIPDGYLANLADHEFIDDNAETGLRYQYGVATLDAKGRAYMRSDHRVTITVQ